MSHREEEYQRYQDRLPTDWEEERECEDRENRLKDVEKQYEKLGKPAYFDVFVGGEYNDTVQHISEALMIAEQYDEEITLKHCEDEMA